MVRIARVRNGATALILATSALLFSACDGESTTAATAAEASADSDADSRVVQPLALSGTPRASVTAGQAYSFTPVASDGASFSIANKPAWATFSTVTGALSGTPSAADVGVYANVVISASNGSSNVKLAAFSISVVQSGASAGSATLSWNPPTSNTDGSAIRNLAGYHIYAGTEADSLDKKIQVTNAGLTAYTVTDLGSGTHYFGITAYTSDGHESGISNIGSKTIM